MRSPHNIRTSLASLVGALCLSTLPTEAAITSLFSFGDSLTDSGNVAAATGGAQPYPSGRFSDGRTFAEYLAEDLGLGPHLPSLAGGNNHAWGGAWTGGGGSVPTVVQQAEGYVGGGGTFLSTDLVTIWAGANDFFFTAPTPEGAINPAISVGNISSAIDILAGAGATQFMVLNLPDLGATPALNGNAGATAWTQAFNLFLTNEMAMLRDALGIRIYENDMYQISGDILSNPNRYGLTNTTDPVFPDLTLDPSETAYWDNVHPTTAVHRLYADSLTPEPSISLLSAIAMGLLTVRRSRPSN